MIDQEQMINTRIARSEPICLGDNHLIIKRWNILSQIGQKIRAIVSNNLLVTFFMN